MWKSVAMRIRGAKTELQNMGLETDGMVESTSKLQEQVKGISGFDIMLNPTTFKSTYDIIVGIGDKWKEISDIDQASLLEVLAGKKQGNALAAALNNVEDIKKSYETALTSSGSAMKEMNTQLESASAKAKQFSANFQELSANLVNSNFIKFIIDTGKQGLEILNIGDGILIKLGLIIGLLPTFIGLWKTIVNWEPLKNIGTSFKQTFTSVKEGITIFPKLISAIKLAKAESISLSSALNTVEASISTTTKAFIALGIAIATIKIIDAIIISQKEAIETASKLSDEYHKIQTEVETLTSKLKENQAKIADINSKPLDIINKNTLTTLELENGELQRQLELTQELEHKSKAKSAQASMNVLSRKDFSYGKVKHGDYSGASRSESDFSTAIAYQVNEVKALTSQFNNLDTSSKNYKKDSENIGRAISFANEELAKNIDLGSKQKENLDLTNPAQKQMYENIVNLENAYIALQTLSPDLNTFNEIWDIKATEEQKNKLIELASQNELTIESFSKNYPVLKILFESIGLQIEEVIAKINGMKKTSKEIIPTSLFSGLDDIATVVTNLQELGTAFKDVSDNGVVTASTMKKLQTELGATDEQLTNLQKAYSSGNQDEVKNQLINIANAYIQNIKNLSSLTDEEQKQLTLELESIGVKNSLVLVEDAVTLAKFRGQVASTDFTTATSGEIDKLIELANKAGIAGNSIELLAKKQKAASDQEGLLKRVNSGELWTNANAQEYIKIRKVLEEPIDTTKILSGTKSVKVDWDKIVNGDGGKKAAKSASDKLSDEFEKAYKYINDLKDRGVITESQYLDKLYVLNEKYNKANLENWLKYDKEIMESRIKLVEDGLKSEGDIYSKAIDNKVKKLEKEKKAEQDLRDENIKSLNNRKEREEKYHNDRIEALNKQKDALQDQAKSEDNLINLEMKKQALEKAKGQKINNVFHANKGFVYEADAETVDNAQRDYNDTKRDIDREKAIQSIDNQIKAEEDLKKSVIDSIEERIRRQERMKEASENLIDSEIENLNTLKDTVQEKMGSIGENLDTHKAQMDAIAQAENLSFDQMKGAVSSYVDTFIAKMEELRIYKANANKIAVSKGSTSTKSIPKHANGTDYAQEGIANVDELGKEFILRNPNQGRYEYLQLGDRVFSHDVSAQILKAYTNPAANISRNLKSSMPNLSSIQPRSNETPISLQIGDINLNGVQDVNGLSRAIVNKLPNQIMQDLFKRK